MKNYFTKTERSLWLGSLAVIVASFFVTKSTNYLTLIASLVGATSLIFNAKGNPVGQALMVLFSILYGVISWEYRYYGEMATYLLMTMPMAVVALVSWLRHPYKGQKSQVQIASLTKSDVVWLCLLTTAVTTVFFFALKAFDTANLALSTVSVTTSFVAVFLTYKRSPYFAIAYAVNDVVLVALWILASFDNASYLSVVVCFVIFLANDLYGFVNWRKTQQKQRQQENA